MLQNVGDIIWWESCGIFQSWPAPMMLQNVGQTVLGLTESGGSHVGFLSPDQLPWCFRMWVRRYWVWQNPVGAMWDVSALTGSCPKMECFWLSGNWPGPHRRDLSVSGMHLWRCSNYLTSTANTIFFFFFLGGGGGGNCGSYYCIKLGLQPCQALNFTEVVSNWNRPPP